MTLVSIFNFDDFGGVVVVPKVSNGSSAVSNISKSSSKFFFGLLFPFGRLLSGETAVETAGVDTANGLPCPCRFCVGVDILGGSGGPYEPWSDGLFEEDPLDPF